MDKLIQRIREELKASIDHDPKEDLRFYKTGQVYKAYGVKTLKVRKIAKKYFSEIKNLNKKEVFYFCKELLKSGYSEESTVAFAWTLQLKNKYDKSDFVVFENWLKKYVDNWSKCDDFCTHALGKFLLQFPEFLIKLNHWTKSPNRWLRRASAVSLIYPNRKNKYLDKSFEIADILLLDPDDLVQKGYGWMLKKVSVSYPEKVFNYVIKNKSKIPRTALCYAIEKLPKDLKQKAMNKINK